MYVFNLLLFWRTIQHKKWKAIKTGVFCWPRRTCAWEQTERWVKSETSYSPPTVVAAAGPRSVFFTLSWVEHLFACVQHQVIVLMGREQPCWTHLILLWSKSANLVLIAIRHNSHMGNPLIYFMYKIWTYPFEMCTTQAHQDASHYLVLFSIFSESTILKYVLAFLLTNASTTHVLSVLLTLCATHFFFPVQMRKKNGWFAPKV